MTEKIYVNDDNFATIICAICKNIRVVDVSKIILNKNIINIRCKCKCGNVFNSVLERRRNYRKDIKFSGNCFLNNEDLKIPVQITDISKSGIKFEHNSQYSFSVGEELHIDFFLDDPDRSLVVKVVIIRSVFNNKIGAEFKSSEHYDKLGSYLLYR